MTKAEAKRRLRFVAEWWSPQEGIDYFSIAGPWDLGDLAGMAAEVRLMVEAIIMAARDGDGYFTEAEIIRWYRRLKDVEKRLPL